MRSAEGSGRTVEGAIREALRILGVKREEVDLIVLDEGSRGVLGLGAREARVRLTLLSEEGEDDVAAAEAERVSVPSGDAGGNPVSVARSVTSSLLEATGFRASVQSREDSGAVLVSITGQQLAPLIGRHGQTLEALELLVNLMVARRMGHRVPVVVDAEHYRERRREAVQALAQRTAARVRRMGKAVALEPMSAAERRVIHTTLALDQAVTTHSEGEGADRHIVILPRTGAVAGARSTQPLHESGNDAEDLDEPDALDAQR